MKRTLFSHKNMTILYLCLFCQPTAYIRSTFQLCSVHVTSMSTFCLPLVFAQSMFRLKFVLRSVFVRLILCCHLPSETISHCLFQDSAQNRSLPGLQQCPTLPSPSFMDNFEQLKKWGEFLKVLFQKYIFLEFHRNSVSASIAILIVQHMSKTFH